MADKLSYILNWSELEMGDIILTRYNDDTSRLVRRLTKSDYSHAQLYMGWGCVLHSDGDGVTSENVQRVAVQNLEDMVVLRVKDDYDFDPFILDEFARSEVGMEYGLDEAKQLYTGKTDIDGLTSNRQICTKYVAMAYAAAGLDIVADPTRCTPQDILLSDKLECIENVVRLATPAEQELLDDGNPILESHTQRMKTLLADVRAQTGLDIQTFSQLMKSCENTENDKLISVVCEDHPYFHVLEKYHELHSEEYDYDLFIEKHGELAKDAAEQLLLTMTRNACLFREQSKTFENLYMKMGSKTVLCFKKLYETLVDDCEKREKLFSRILRG